MFEQFKNMDRRTGLALAVAALVSILAFGAIAGVIRQSGWNEGFMYGLTAGGGDGAKAIAPYVAAHGGYGPHGWGWHPFGFIGGIFRFFFFGFLLLMFLKLVGFWRWRMHGGPHGPWRHGPWQHGPWEQPPYSQPQPEAASKPAESPAPPSENQPQNTSWTRV